jgi:hypothetical protein
MNSGSTRPLPPPAGSLQSKPEMPHSVPVQVDSQQSPPSQSQAARLLERLSVPSTANENCVAQVQEVPPIYMSLTDETSSSQLLLLNDYADLHPSDAFEVPNGCRDSAPLQSSVRIPLADFCAGSDLLLDELTQVTLTFEEYTEVVIDSLEFGGSPGDPSRADCKCL